MDFGFHLRLFQKEDKDIFGKIILLIIFTSPIYYFILTLIIHLSMNVDLDLSITNFFRILMILFLILCFYKFVLFTYKIFKVIRDE